MDVRRADHGHDERNDRCYHTDQFGAKIVVARDPRVSRQHLRRCVRLLPQACGSTAAVGREAFVDAKKPLYTACDYMLGLACQRLGPIGQTGTTVHRDASHGRCGRAVGPSGPRIGEDGTVDGFSQCMSCCSHLDEPREPSGATRGPRGRPPRPPPWSPHSARWLAGSLGSSKCE